MAKNSSKLRVTPEGFPLDSPKFIEEATKALERSAPGAKRWQEYTQEMARLFLESAKHRKVDEEKVAANSNQDASDPPAEEPKPTVKPEDFWNEYEVD